MKAIGCLVVTVFLALGVGLVLMGSYNSLVGLSQAVDAQWAQVESAYQRRADLIPNLVATVSGAANFEKSTLEAVTQARASVGQVRVNPGDAASMADFERAQSSPAKYWMERGGFKTTILGTKKVGQVHFKWLGDKNKLQELFPKIKMYLIENAIHITENMERRGGGISKIDLLDFTDAEDGLYQLLVHFETCDSMGANFINSVLESFASSLEAFFVDYPDLEDIDRDLNIIMAILSNYTPECVVRAEVSCKIEELGTVANGIVAEQLAEKFRTAVKIAHIDPQFR